VRSRADLSDKNTKESVLMISPGIGRDFTDRRDKKSMEEGRRE